MPGKADARQAKPPFSPQGRTLTVPATPTNRKAVGSLAKGKYEKWLEPAGLTLLEGWARDGLTDEQIAHNCGISVKTLYDWKNRHREICEALKKGKEVVDLEVENALLRSALGYTYDEVMTEESEDGFKKRITTKMVLPSVTAQIFWLKNRRPEAWRDKPPESPDTAKENNLLDAILEGTKGELKADDIPELQQATGPDADMVEPGGDSAL